MRAVRCAFIGLRSDAFDGEDDLVLSQELHKYDWDVSPVDWKDSTVDWDLFDIAIFRSPWDYHLSPERFTAFLDRLTTSRCQLINSGALIRFNFDKRYLVELGKRADFVIPTRLWQREDGVDLKWFLEQSYSTLRTDEIVVKPTVGAGSDRTFRVKRRELDSIFPCIETAAEQRDLLIQPFLPTILGPGEFSLIFIEGQYYHSILKQPKDGDFRVQSEHGGRYERIEPEPWLVQTSQALLNSIAPTAVYARLDWILHPDEDSDVPFLLMEAELIEPDLYLRYTTQGIFHFAKALVRAYQPKELGQA